jgi:hypothetical protein
MSSYVNDNDRAVFPISDHILNGYLNVSMEKLLCMKFYYSVNSWSKSHLLI